jgi:hypothetical protein
MENHGERFTVLQVLFISMPSIAQFIKDLLAEEKHSGDFSNRIQERIETLNAAQLQGLYQHLTNSANNSKTKLWKSANEEIVLKIRIPYKRG